MTPGPFLSMITLRPEQVNTVTHVRTRESITPRVRMCVQSPTGTGKSIIMSALLMDDKPQLVLTHRRVLIDQLARVLDEFGISYGFRVAGKELNPTAPIQLAMVQTEYQRAFRRDTISLHPCQRLHIDELHQIKGTTAQAIMDRYRAEGAAIIGYTATSVDLGGVVDECHVSITVSKAIDRGYLCPPLVFSIEQPDPKAIEQLRTDAKGEFLPKDLGKLIRPDKIKGRVIQHYKRLSPDGRAFILFAHSVKASIWWAQYLSAQGLPTAHIDGDNLWVDGKFFKSDSAKRREVFDRVERGEIRGLTNRFVLREGVDLPCIGHAILTSPVGSRMSFVQMCGRVLRPFGDREYAIIQDHSGTCTRHPALDSDEPWDWTLPAGLSERMYIARMRENEDPEPIVCPQCNLMRYIGDVCPFCGFAYRKHARYVEQTDGELRLIEGKQFRPRHVSYRSGDAKLWERAYWGAVKHSPHRTFEQVYTFIAVQNNWHWLRRDLPLMPRDAYNWFLPVGQVDKSALIPKEKQHS